MHSSAIRSFVAVLAAFLAITLLFIGTDLLVARLRAEVFTTPSDSVWWYIVPLLYRTGFTVFGGYVAGVLAPSKPVFHATVLGVLCFLFAFICAFLMWMYVPAWYALLPIVLAPVSAWAGGKAFTYCRWWR